MGVNERKARQKEELRQDILDAARDLFVKQGYESVSMRKIAEKIEYSPTTIYLYFKDKSEIFDCLCEETFAKLIKKFDSVDWDNSDDPVQSLRKGLKAYVEFGLKHPDHYRITFLMNDGNVAEKGRQDTGSQAFGCLREGVTACVSHQRFRENNIDKVSQILWAGIHGVTSLLVVHPDFEWINRNELIEGTIDALLEGLKRP